MTTFLRLLADKDKAASLAASCAALRAGEAEARVFQVTPESFRAVPGAPFAYWVSEAVREIFKKFPGFESTNRHVALGLSTKNDVRFVRTVWEVAPNAIGRQLKWSHYANGGSFSRFYFSYSTLVLAENNFTELRAYIAHKFPYLGGNTGWVIHDENDYNSPAIAWPLRTHAFSPHLLPAGYVFSARTYAACAPEVELSYLLGFLASAACDALLKISLGRSGHPEFVTGVVRVLPLPELRGISKLVVVAKRAWSLKRTLDTIEETSHAFLLPAALRARLGDYDPPAIEAELARIQAEIDAIAFDLYGFAEGDKAAVLGGGDVSAEVLAEGDSADVEDQDEGSEEDESTPSGDVQTGLLSWCVGVGFGRFDWRVATGEREPPPDPEPFEPLPAKSPGMHPDGAAPLHVHPGILVDDPGHPHDLPHLVESVLDRVEMPVATDVRRWLQREFFPEHLKRYSKSRRKAPIYWPLSTLSGSYTLWVYYPSLTSQTLYSAVNDFVEPKLKSVSQNAHALRAKGSRSRGEEKELEQLQDFELELKEFRETLLHIAQGYAPDHNDGVQITAAPLWPLFQHTPWQKVLKDTWKKLEKGDYDWAHLAYAYWPERVREKCKTDKSLAIAHNLESLYQEKPATAKKSRTRKT